MARVVTGARVEPGGLGGVNNQNKRNETVVTASSAANARINAGGAAGAARAVSPARFCPGSPHGDSFTSVPASSVPPTPINQARPGSKDNSVCLTSAVREPAAGVAQVANSAPTANQLSRSEQHIVKRTPVAQASNSERTVRFNPVVEILECPRRRCGGGRGSPGGSPLSPPPMLPPSPPLSRRGSRPRGGGLRATQYHRSPTPPPSHRKGPRRNYTTGGVGSNAVGGSSTPGGSRGLGEGSGVGLARNRRALRFPSPTSNSPTASSSNMGVAHQAPVRLAWRALAGRSAPRQAASLRPLRRRSGPGPTLATKGVRGRGQRTAYGMAVLSSGMATKPSQSNTSASTNALGACTTQPPASTGPTSQSTPALQPPPSSSQQQGNVPLPPPSEELKFHSATASPVDSHAVIPLPPPPPPSLASSASPVVPTSSTPTADTSEPRVGSAGSRGTYHTATTNVSPPSSASSTTSTRSGSEPPSGSFFGPKAGFTGLRSVPAKTSMSLATAQSTMAGVALARARAASVVARAGIIDTTPPAPPPSRGSEYNTMGANAMVGAFTGAATTTVAVVSKLPRQQQDDVISNSSKADSDTSSAPALSMALMHPLPLPATAISSTRDARTPTALTLTPTAVSTSAVNQRPSLTEGNATIKERVSSPSPSRGATKGHKTVSPSTRPGSNNQQSRTGGSTPASQAKVLSPGSNTTIAAPGNSTNKPGGDDGASTSGNSAGFSILSGVPSVTGGCLAEMLSRSRNATLAEQGEGMLRVGGARNTTVTRVEVPATWSVDTSADDKTTIVAAVDAATTERSRAAGDSIIGKSKEHVSSKGVRPFSPSSRKPTAKGPKTSEGKKSTARDRLSPALDERGDRTEKGERLEKVEKRVSLKDTVDHSESGNTKCLSGSSLNSMLKVAAPKGIRKKSQKRNHSVEKDHTKEIVPANSVPNVIETPPPPPSSAAMSPLKINRPPGSGGSSGGGGGGGVCMAGALGGVGGAAGVTPGIVAGGGAIASLVRVASGSKANRLSIGSGLGSGIGLEKMISITPQTSMTSQISQPPTTIGEVTSPHMDIKVGKKGKRKAADELLDAAKLGKFKVKEKKKSAAGKVTKKKDDGSRIAIKGVKDSPPRRSLSLTELGRTLRSGCWTLVEACIRGTKAAANGNPPQLTVVFRAKGSGPAPATPLFRPPPTPPAGPSTQRQWTNRPTRLTSASTSSRLSVVGERTILCRAKMGSTRGSSAGSSRDMRVRNKASAGGGATGGGRGVRNIRRRSAQKRRPNTPARRRVPSGMVRLRGPRRGRRPSGTGLDSRGSTGSANRLRARTVHRATLAPPSRRTNRGARRYPLE